MSVGPWQCHMPRQVEPTVAAPVAGHAEPVVVGCKLPVAAAVHILHHHHRHHHHHHHHHVFTHTVAQPLHVQQLHIDYSLYLRPNEMML